MATNEAYLDAVKAGDVAAVKAMLAAQPELVQARADPGVSALLLALYYGKPEIAQAILAHKPELDIFEAAALGQTKRVISLLAADAALANAVAPDGFQPLGLAAFMGHFGAAQALVQAGADVNSPSRNGQRVMPLHSAAAAQQLEIARLLIAHGAEINATQEGDFTPLHGAAQNGQLPLVELLLASGAAVNPRARDGKTPLAFAREHHHSEVAALLEARGGEI